MKNFLFFIILVTVLVIIGGLFINEVKKEKIAPLPITMHEYYWSETCPHCAKVAEFMNSWDKKDQFDLQKFEISKSGDNAKLLVQRGTACAIPQNELGVPLLVTPQGQCIIGDEPIIEYLKSLEISNEENSN